MNKMRLNKYLAACGVGSRRKIDSLAEEKKILVNGFLATLGQQVDDQDEIIVDGVKIESSTEKKIYFMLNKPLHVLSTAKDWRGRKSVVDLIDCPQRIFPVGRLDYDTTGLILLTNDGELAHKILHPRNEIYKEYYVTILGKLSRENVFSLEDGMELNDGITLPAKVKVLRETPEESLISISIREGRKRQIRRMFRQLQKPLLALRREKIGELSVEGLESGKYRELTKKEIQYLYSL